MFLSEEHLKWLPEDYFLPVFSVKRYTRYVNKRSKDIYAKLFIDEKRIEEPPEWGLPHPNPTAAYMSLSKYKKDFLNMTEDEVSDYNLAWEWTEKAYFPYMGNSRIISCEEAIRDLDMQTSCGYPFNLFYKSKAELFEKDLDFPTFLQHDWDIEMLQPNYFFLWINSLKEEIRPEEKTKLNKIRTFTSSALDGTVQGKRLFDDMNKKMNDSHLKTASAIGMSPYEGNWDKLYRKLAVFENGFALDESEYDSSLRSFMMWGCARLRWHMLRDEDRTPENLIRFKNYYRNLVNSLIITPEGVVVMKQGGNPSGSVNTINDNTLILDTLMAYAWIRCCRKKDIPIDYGEFHLNTARALVGDDNTWTVSNYALPFYNAKSVIAIWGTLGITTTTDTDEPRHPRDLDFLSAKSLNYFGIMIPIYNREKLLTSLLYSNTGKQSPAFTLLRAGAMMQVGWSDVQFRRFCRELIAWLFENYDEVLKEDKDWIQAKTCIHSDPFLERLFCGEILYPQSVGSAVKTIEPDKMNELSFYEDDRRGRPAFRATRQTEAVRLNQQRTRQYRVQNNGSWPKGTMFHANGDVAFVPRQMSRREHQRETAFLRNRDRRPDLDSLEKGPRRRRKERKVKAKKANRPKQRVRGEKKVKKQIKKAQAKQEGGRRRRRNQNKRERRQDTQKGEFGREGSGWLDTLMDVGGELLPHLIEFGMGDYEEGEAPMKEGDLPKTNSLLAAATEGDAGYAVPAMHSSGTSTRVCHREYLGDVYSSTSAFVPLVFPVNPGMAETFPWLAPVANQYTSYQFMGLNFEFVSQGSDYANAAGLGYVAYASQYNVASPAFLDKREMLNYQFADACKPSKNMCHWVECQPDEVPLPEKFVRAGTPPAGTDLRFYDHANFTVAVGGNTAAGSIIGQLWCTYDVKLVFPRVSESAAGVLNYYKEARSGVAVGDIFGTAGVPDARSTMAVVIAPMTITFPNNVRGDYEISFFWSGAAAVGTNQPTFSVAAGTGTNTPTVPVAAATDINYWARCIYTITANGAVLTQTASNANGIPYNTVTIIITQIPRVPSPNEALIFDRLGKHADEKTKALLSKYADEEEKKLNRRLKLSKRVEEILDEESDSESDDDDDWEILRVTKNWTIEESQKELSLRVRRNEDDKLVVEKKDLIYWRGQVMDASAANLDDLITLFQK
jgi:hypothetical protein